MIFSFSLKDHSWYSLTSSHTDVILCNENLHKKLS
jgi:hypothetical protein